MIVNSFRGKRIPSYIKSKTALIEYVLVNERDNEPISNGEFVFDLMCTRFGGVIHDLREEGYEIVTVPTEEKGHFKYYLIATPKEKRDNINKNMRLI
tara:strand:- start:141 stop:431 length:291 start_codon:yes stop_codon:yes gene_type:complete